MTQPDPEFMRANILLAEQQFPLFSYARKKSGSEWEGRVVGYYSTEFNPLGVCVESAFHKHSVQIYPAKALEVIDDPA